MIKLYIVRHGQTDYNLKQIVQNKYSTLNETGINQANKVKEKLKTIEYDLIISSPYIRTKQTSEIININNKQIIFDDRLIERNMGELEENHMNYDTYNSKLYWDYNLNLSDRGIESIKSIFERTEDFINYIKENYKNKTLVIVSHQATIRALHHVINNTDRNSDLYKFKVDNASVLEYEIDE